jgi:hypothetical protein
MHSVIVEIDSVLENRDNDGKLEQLSFSSWAGGNNRMQCM